MPDAFPRLRGEVDAAPASRDGETYYILYDRAGITPSRLLVSAMGLLIAGRLDGSSSVLEIADTLSREYGGIVACSEVEMIVDALDEALFLDGSRFQDFHAQAVRDFRTADIRQPGSAGSAYADDADTLTKELEAMLAGAPAPEESPARRDRHPKGIIVPHIDYIRGAPGYGQAYRLLKERPAPETVVVLGTAHIPLGERFSLCDKDFATPLGTVGVDRDLSDHLRRSLLPLADVDSDILAHRGEHSIELQAVWLRHIYGDGVRIVPLLSASLGEFIDGDRDPSEAIADPVLAAMSACLGEMVEREGVMLMASADLSHVGPRFGDSREVTNQFMAEVEDVDRDYLEAVAVSALAGLEVLAGHRDRYHVCGSACIYTLGRALNGARAHLLGYHQAVTPEMRQAVTYAAMVFD